MNYVVSIAFGLLTYKKACHISQFLIYDILQIIEAPYRKGRGAYTAGISHIYHRIKAI
jgi:hypothetical protein